MVFNDNKTQNKEIREKGEENLNLYLGKSNFAIKQKTQMFDEKKKHLLKSKKEKEDNWEYRLTLKLVQKERLS